MLKKIRLFLCLLPVPTGLHSLEISSFTAVRENGKIVAEAEFSKAIKIKNIECFKDSVLLPEEKKKDKTFRNIKLLSKKIYLALENCCNKKSCGLSAEKKIPDFKIHSVAGLSSPYRIANVSVVFDDDILAVFGVLHPVRNPDKREANFLTPAITSSLEPVSKTLNGAVARQISNGVKPKKGKLKASFAENFEIIDAQFKKKLGSWILAEVLK